VLAAVLTGSACGERSEPLDDVRQPYPVTVQGAGDRPAVVPRPPQRVVALEAGSAELLVALEIERRLVGVPADVPGAEGATAVVPRTGRIDVATVVALEPDLIVATPTVDLVDVSRAARESGAALYVQPAASVDDVLRAVRELGFVVGEPSGTRRLAARIRAALERVEAAVANAPTTTVFVDTGFFTTVAGRSLLGDLVRRAGGENVAGEAPAPESFDPERLVRLDPDVYLATSDSRLTLERLRRDPRTARLTAVREGRFAVLPADLVFRPGPRVGEALERIARVLHPDAFG
jgi:iron complex transport system substrate-binding protein